MRVNRSVGISVWASCLFLSLSAVAAEEAPDFARDVRPILSQHCFKCHGPDENSRQSGLRLDLAQAAAAGGDSQQPAIVAGRASQSELYKRVISSDPDLVMPPPSTKRSLSPQQVETLRRWIDHGAAYREHWAFQPRSEDPAPTATGAPARVGTNMIDLLINQQLAAQGLPAAEEAERGTWLRRIYLDVIGLPPTFDEVMQYRSDPRPDAKARVIDRLLASPRFGERWARRWLDLARYADTNGYEKDRPRSIWPYRDWVIDAFNDDLSQADFAIAQLAGDLLPQASQAQRIATGFHRNTMINEEGGIDPLEYRYYAMVDRVNTTSTAWLGLTVGCAQCHDHKYDPITQKDYFGLMALLNDVEEPEMEVIDPLITARRAETDRHIDQLRTERRNRFAKDGALANEYEKWLDATAGEAARWQLLTPSDAVANMARLEPQSDGSYLAIGDISKRDEYRFKLADMAPGTTGLLIEALTDPSLPKQGPGRTYYEGPIGDFFLSEIDVLAPGQQPVALRAAWVDFAQKGREADKTLDNDPLTGWSIDSQQGQPHRLVIAFDGPLPQATSLTLNLLFERYYAAPIGRVRLWSTSSPGLSARSAQLPPRIQGQLVDAAAGVADARSKQASGKEPSKDIHGHDEGGKSLIDYFFEQSSAMKDLNDRIEQLEKDRPKYATTLVMHPRPVGFVRPTFRYHRGEFLNPREEIAPAVPVFLSHVTPDPPRDRMALAKWLFSSDHPLTARVLANRYWAYLFGRGLVATEEDFGFQGSFPSNQPLLDWLAANLAAEGIAAGDTELMWSLKRWLRPILESDVYARSSRAGPESFHRDATNLHLARATRRRLDAEQLRDAALASAGLLDVRMGGPSVFPPQPASVTTEGTYGKLQWQESHGADRYRRGLYTYSKRTAPFAMLNTFDAPSGEACVARREAGNTPLQALTVLNDVLFLEASKEIGYRVATPTTPQEHASIVRQLFRQILLRDPDSHELSEMQKYLMDQLLQLESRPASVQALGAGNAETTTGASPQPIVAAATLLARVLFNTDEFINRN